MKIWAKEKCLREGKGCKFLFSHPEYNILPKSVGTLFCFAITSMRLRGENRSWPLRCCNAVLLATYLRFWWPPRLMWHRLPSNIQPTEVFPVLTRLQQNQYLLCWPFFLYLRLHHYHLLVFVFYHLLISPLLEGSVSSLDSTVAEPVVIKLTILSVFSSSPLSSSSSCSHRLCPLQCNHFPFTRGKCFPS